MVFPTMAHRSPLRFLSVVALTAALMWGPRAAEADVVHVVGKGQTLFHIARIYRTTPEAIREANNLREKQLIHPGLSLTIPGVQPKASTKSTKAADKEKSAKPGDKHKDAKAKDAKAKDEKEPKDAKKTKESKDAKSKDAKAKDEKDEKEAKRSKKAKKDADASKTADTRKTKGDPYAATPKKPGQVTLIRGTERATAQVLTRGKLNQASLPVLTRMLRHVPSDSKKAIDPRLAHLIGLVSDHFGGRPLHVVSGYRPYSKAQYTPHSNHNHGRAFDFIVEGVPNTVVRDYCRTFRDAGVGYYPNSTFTHLDVRTGKAYWIDYSGPGEAPRYQLRGKGKADEAARDVESTEASTGSEKTQNSEKQPAESKTESAAPTTPDASRRHGGGLKTPTPAAPPSGATPSPAPPPTPAPTSPN